MKAKYEALETALRQALLAAIDAGEYGLAQELARSAQHVKEKVARLAACPVNENGIEQGHG